MMSDDWCRNTALTLYRVSLVLYNIICEYCSYLNPKRIAVVHSCPSYNITIFYCRYTGIRTSYTVYRVLLLNNSVSHSYFRNNGYDGPPYNHSRFSLTKAKSIKQNKIKFICSVGMYTRKTFTTNCSISLRRYLPSQQSKNSLLHMQFVHIVKLYTYVKLEGLTAVILFYNTLNSLFLNNII